MRREQINLVPCLSKKNLPFFLNLFHIYLPFLISLILISLSQSLFLSLSLSQSLSFLVSLFLSLSLSWSLSYLVYLFLSLSLSQSLSLSPSLPLSFIYFSNSFLCSPSFFPSNIPSLSSKRKIPFSFTSPINLHSYFLDIFG